MNRIAVWGSRIVQNLLNANYQVVVYKHTAEKVEPFQGGDAMYLAALLTFQKRWQGNNGLKEFQAHIHTHLSLT